MTPSSLTKCVIYTAKRHLTGINFVTFVKSFVAFVLNISTQRTQRDAQSSQTSMQSPWRCAIIGYVCSQVLRLCFETPLFEQGIDHANKKEFNEKSAKIQPLLLTSEQAAKGAEYEFSQSF
ncbi:MAG: hypothetical protein FWH27_02370 [Planctomycetaceae bacterium]|nr:hypothetical protein [Planctomycetaceae bacterium]